MADARLILASTSPRRRDLLREAGYDFEVEPADVDESFYPTGLIPPEVAQYLAREKALAVAKRRPDDTVLGADTVVSFGDYLLGKPADAKEARQMLLLLSGTTHLVSTGVAVAREGGKFVATGKAISAVRMRLLTAGEIDAYVATGQWEGKAGGYGIQDNDPFVTRMNGSHTNIVGLPMELTSELLAGVGIFPK